MDWLEAFFPFLEDIDRGSGALEIALVVLVIGIIGVTGLAAVRRRRTDVPRPVDFGPARDEEAGSGRGQTMP